MTEPTGEQFHDSPDKLGFAFGIVGAKYLESQFKNEAFRGDDEVHQLGFDIFTVRTAFERGLPQGTWAVYRDMKRIDIGAFEEVVGMDDMVQRYQQILEEASEAPAAEVHNELTIINTFLAAHPGLVRMTSERNAPFVVSVDAEWKPYRNDALPVHIPADMLVTLSDGTIERNPLIRNVLIDSNELPAYGKWALLYFRHLYGVQNEDELPELPSEADV